MKMEQNNSEQVFLPCHIYVKRRTSAGLDWKSDLPLYIGQHYLYLFSSTHPENDYGAIKDGKT